MVTGEGEDRTLVAGQLLAQARPWVLLVVETSDITAGKATVDYTQLRMETDTFDAETERN